MGSFLVGRSKTRFNRPVEVSFLGVNDITLVGSATCCSFLKLSCDLTRRYIVLYFLTKRSFLLPTNHKIRGLVGSQNGTSIHWSVPISLQDPGINLYTSVVEFFNFRRLVESPLHTPYIMSTKGGSPWLTARVLRSGNSQIGFALPSRPTLQVFHVQLTLELFRGSNQMFTVLLYT